MLLVALLVWMNVLIDWSCLMVVKRIQMIFMHLCFMVRACVLMASLILVILAQG